MFAFSEYTSRYNFQLKTRQWYWINSPWLFFFNLEQNSFLRYPSKTVWNGSKPRLEFSRKTMLTAGLRSWPRRSWRKGRAKSGLFGGTPTSSLLLTGLPTCWFPCAMLEDFELANYTANELGGVCFRVSFSFQVMRGKASTCPQHLLPFGSE